LDWPIKERDSSYQPIIKKLVRPLPRDAVAEGKQRAVGGFGIARRIGMLLGYRLLAGG
jgi:hypothetical protein